jgi:hypothetical protein
VALNSLDSALTAGGFTTLSWSSTDADSCTASGAWSGARAPSGSTLVGPIDRQSTFSITCSGPGGNAMQMVSVSVLGELSISWVQPSKNVDGSPLTDLASYRIYYGAESRSYSQSIDVADAVATSHAFTALSGDYFVTMTALDLDGNESAYSNEILRSVP